MSLCPNRYLSLQEEEEDEELGGTPSEISGSDVCDAVYALYLASACCAFESLTSS
jgi:hypothetical protein